MKCDNCSRTDKTFFTNVKLVLSSFRITGNGTTQEIKNSKIETSENICADCLGIFIDRLDLSKGKKNVSES